MATRVRGLQGLFQFYTVHWKAQTEHQLATTVDLDSANIVAAHEVRSSELRSFYAAVYPNRYAELKDHWNWLYRPQLLNGAIPLVMEMNGKIIAQAGMIPFEMMVDRRKITACWYVDFAVIPEYQRMGIGIRMSEKWMSLGDLHVTFCNSKSLGVFRKLGWKEGEESISHLFPLVPLNNRNMVKEIPSLVRYIVNRVTSRMLYPYSNNAWNLSNCKILPVNSDNIAAFLSNESMNGTIRNKDYFEWRVLSAPDRDSYHVFTCNESSTSALVKLRPDRNISILSINSVTTDTIIKLIASVANWALKNNFLNLYFLTADQTLSEGIHQRLGGVVSRPIFAFHSNNSELEHKFALQVKTWERLDSDFDLI